MRFELEGRIVPYVRMTQKGKHGARAQAYLASKGALSLQFKSQMGAPMFEKGKALGVSITIYMAKSTRSCDMDNQVKALLDSMNGIVYYDDRDINRIYAHRVRADEDFAVVNVIP